MNNKYLLIVFCLCLKIAFAQDSTTINHLPKCIDSLRAKNDSTTTLFFHVHKTYKVNLVPVNSTDTIYKEKLETELNKIYYPYGVNISLNVLNKIEEKSWDLNNDGKLDVGETGILNFRTDEMKAVHRLNENKNAEEIYLYIMQTPSKAGVEGDMPLGSQYGFLFGEPSARTLSHEIAHGYFQLKHSFDESIALQKSSTNNLMDYANGNALYKYQWDLVHDKGLMIAKLWQNDSAGEFKIPIHYKMVDEILDKYKQDLSSIARLQILDGVSWCADILNAGSDIHFDERIKYSEFEKTWNNIYKELNELKNNFDEINKNVGGFNNIKLGLLLHSVQDFYSHSNFVELYIKYYMNNNNDIFPLEIPTYKESLKNKKFFNEYLKKFLVSGDFHLIPYLKGKVSDEWIKSSPNRDVIASVKNLRIHHDQMAKDNFKMGKIITNKKNQTLNTFDMALKVARKQTKQIIEDVIKKK